MDSSLYRLLYPFHVLVYIEDFDRSSGIVLFDFIDSTNYRLFLNLMDLPEDLEAPSMVELSNYGGKRVMPNTVYAIAPETFEAWRTQQITVQQNADSYLIGHDISLTDSVVEVFSDSITVLIEKRIGGYNDNIPLTCAGKVRVVIRDVKQGNWNEVYSNNQCVVVFDAGTCTRALKSDVEQLIESRLELYADSKPVLILSHWDKDHYHCLLGMDESQIGASFSYFIYRDILPNLTSERLYNKIEKALETTRVCGISPDQQRKIKKVPPKFVRLTDGLSRVDLYNAGHSKDRNVSGLAISIKTVSSSVILGGDALYEQLSRDILPILNYGHTHNLVVPHHGGKAGKFKYKKLLGIKFGEAIISVGANPYGHPLEKNVNSLKGEGFHVRQTNFEKEDIVIAL